MPFLKMKLNRQAAPERRRRRPIALLHRLMPRKPAPVPAPALAPVDAVAITAFALSRVGPASMRASFTGRAVEVVAPDERTAAVIRAALAETGRECATDRLVKVVVR